MQITYFGYGANSSLGMMEGIIGRKPSGFPATLEGYELYIQSWEEIPEKVREDLEKYWDSDFKTYCIRRAVGKKVSGTAWLITPEERQLVSNWEFWYEPISAEVRDAQGQTTSAETEVVNDQTIGEIVNGERYPVFLNSKEQMVDVAEKIRHL